MADEAFALSPISARAAQPGEADYDAIREAFMETSRGRWFLSEYAKRNRNADTRMVLDAVARIEENLAAQKNAAPDDGLEVLAVIRDAVDEAKAAAAAAFGGVEESLEPIRKGAQVIRETLSRLREIGADGRIYDLIDSQVGAIETGCSDIVATDSKAALNAAFDLIEQRIARLADEGMAQQSPVSETPGSPPAAAYEVAPAATARPAAPCEGGTEDLAAASPTQDSVVTVRIETATIDADVAHDDAVLDMIALEMAAPDFDDAGIVETDMLETSPADPDIVAQAAEPTTAPRPDPAPMPDPSLGASLIANGIVRNPGASDLDPLAPIRRMSQAEKIAFFS
ncbi:hypothetical protein [Bradyrhizobium sp.]|jgi:hypothetical protein|uniref:hypothetical protein n=1 Tax=Bradyrhizobium sp. TaxID=376 RepID=UPI002DF86268|nr:hypothetical protein [Bradyrhizobium sp.]